MSDNETKRLEKLYFEDLAKIVNYGGGNRPRVRHPNNWPNAKKHNRQIGQHKKKLLLEGEQKIWMWSDLHFFHKNIIRFSDRPYPDVETMNEHLVANFNELVGPNDISIWGGDVGFGNNTQVNELVDQCNGYKILVVGNHDFNKRKVRNLNFDETHMVYLIDTLEVSLLFTHYPMYNIPYPYVNVHGHLHVYPNPISHHDRHININCELQEYKPIPLDETIKKARMRLMVAEK